MSCNKPSTLFFSTKMMLVITLITDVFMQGMSMAVQSSLVQGQNVSVESSGAKIIIIKTQTFFINWLPTLVVGFIR